MKIFTKDDSIDVVFMDGINQVTAQLSLDKLKDLILDEAFEMITTPECNETMCAINGFCECSPINEDMEFAAIYFNTKSILNKYRFFNEEEMGDDDAFTFELEAETPDLAYEKAYKLYGPQVRDMLYHELK